PRAPRERFRGAFEPGPAVMVGLCWRLGENADAVGYRTCCCGAARRMFRSQTGGSSRQNGLRPGGLKQIVRRAPDFIIVGEFTETSEAPAAFAELACNLVASGEPLFVGVSEYLGGATEAEAAM